MSEMNVFRPEPGWAVRWLREGCVMILRAPETILAFLVATVAASVAQSASAAAGVGVDIALFPVWLVIAVFAISRMLRADGRVASFSVTDGLRVVIVEKANLIATMIILSLKLLALSLLLTRPEAAPAAAAAFSAESLISGSRSAALPLLLTGFTPFYVSLVGVGFPWEGAKRLSAKASGMIGLHAVAGGLCAIVAIVVPAPLVLLLLCGWAYCGAREMIGGVRPGQKAGVPQAA